MNMNRNMKNVHEEEHERWHVPVHVLRTVYLHENGHGHGHENGTWTLRRAFSGTCT